MAKSKTQYVCQSCGASAARWFGKCDQCGQWNTCVEEVVAATDRGSSQPGLSPASEPTPITEIRVEGEERQHSGMDEFDRALGGGIVPGSVVLVAGDPGIGKSTLLLQVLAQVAGLGVKTLYVSGEESARQVRMRAGRIGALEPGLLILAETDLQYIEQQIQKHTPLAVVVDSVQAVYCPDMESAPGSVSQVRECAARLMHIAKRSAVAVFLVGHVTKEGAIAGPRLLEHMVDTVLYLEGDRHHAFRILRTVKNRFGSTNEIGVFEMRSTGMMEVTNPSEVFLSERPTSRCGSMVVCSMEGTRPLLVEIQSLVAPSSFGNPQRVCTGVDPRRLSILIAVLEKRVGLHLGGQDIFLNVAGGARIDEPSVDLGAALAVASSFRDLPTDPHSVAIGEIGLGGEVRAVSQVEKRIAEARKLGFRKCILSKRTAKGLAVPDGMQVIGVPTLTDALEVALSG